MRAAIPTNIYGAALYLLYKLTLFIESVDEIQNSDPTNVCGCDHTNLSRRVKVTTNLLISLW